MSTRAASRYAKAILDIAHSKGVATEVGQDMTQIAETIASHAELRAFLEDETNSMKMKFNAVSEIFGASNGGF